MTQATVHNDGLVKISLSKYASATCVGKLLRTHVHIEDVLHSALYLCTAASNPNTIKSVLLYGSGLGVSTEFPLTLNTTCQQRIEALGVKAEFILSHHNISTVLTNETAQNAFVDALGVICSVNKVYGVSLDWENVIEKKHEEAFHKLLGAMRQRLNSDGTRLTMYTNGEAIYGNWKSYFAVTDRLLDGSCYMSESEEHWRRACRPINGLNHTDHQAPALLSGRSGGKPGKWGYTREAAEDKMNISTLHHLPEVAMFNLASMAEWWPRLLQKFLNGSSLSHP
eukprot:m.279052 g.279052  ORF g.279052 m.279052 type:complete len:282 (-) comp19796_c0_seq4:663-1508(-)